ncbi:MAG: 16S rRNA (guanine(527)-N(7))-methyltransferase RsmG [Paenibacillaceae bacterium]
MDEVVNRFTSLLEEKGITLTLVQLSQFELYYQELIEWNGKMNLTGITDREQVYIKHFYDSVSLSFFIPMASIQTLIDIGSGAGFPSIPLKIVYPHLKITIVDSLNKRIQFLQHIVKKLELITISCIHSRAEDAARDLMLRNHYDLATARAVARLSVLNELCLPFVRENGLFAAMKGTDVQEEIKEADYSVKQLLSEFKEVHSFELPMEQAQRHIIIIGKNSKTPAKYPRKAGIPSKEPLVKS